MVFILVTTGVPDSVSSSDTSDRLSPAPDTVTVDPADGDATSRPEAVDTSGRGDHGSVGVDWDRTLGDVGSLRARGPFVIEPLGPRLVSKLERGFAIAVDRLGQHPSCRQLFTDLDADGFEKLLKTIYLEARRVDVRPVCRSRHAVAYTSFRRPHTRLCPAFRHLPDTRAAIIVLHEALHYAGLPEAPAFPDAMWSGEINRMVEKACGF